MAAYLVDAKFCNKFINPGLEGMESFPVIGLFERNCVEWILCDMASMMLGVATVTLYDSLGKDSTE